MRKITLMLCLIMFVFSCKNEQDTLLTGKIENVEDQNLILVFNGERDTVDLSEQGTFRHKLNVQKATYGSLLIGSHAKRIFIEPQKELKIQADLKDNDQNITYTGNIGIENQYIQQIDKMEADMEKDFNSVFMLEPKAFVLKTDSMRSVLEAFMNESLKEKNVSDVFKKLEKARIFYNWANQRNSYPRYYMYLNQKDVPELPAGYYSFEDELSSEDAEFLPLNEYKQYLSMVLSKAVDKAYEEEGLEGKGVDTYYELNFNCILSSFENQQIKNYMLYDVVGKIVNYMDLAKVPGFIDRFNENCTDAIYKEKIATEYSKWERLEKGQPAPDFTYQSIDGKEVSLSDFLGYYVYIDVWATWCGPCKAEIPALKQLEKEFHGKNIVFMSVSVDESKEKWAQMVKKENLSGVQLWSGNGWKTNITSDYMIKGIPRFILVDREGKIFNVKAPRPSENIKEILNSLEGI